MYLIAVIVLGIVAYVVGSKVTAARKAEEQRQKNRERWRRYAATKRARRKAK